MADVIIGAKLEADASGAINSVKNFKQELRLAQQEVVTLSDKFGATSKEAAAAAMRAAELKDKIGDAAQLVDAFNPDTKFRAFGASIQTVVGGFTALTGAMGLLGVESEEVQKTLLKVQSALALSQGISQLQEGMQSIKNLGAVLVNTLGKSGLIGIAIAGVGALALAFSGLFRRNQDLIEANKEYIKGMTTASVEMTKLKNSIDQAKSGVISKDDALKEYNSTLGQVTGEVQSLDAAEMLMASNADTYIKIQGLKAKANLLLQKSAEFAANAEIDRLAIETGGKGGVFGGAIGRDIKESEQKAKELEGLVNGINQQISTLQGTVQKSIGGSFGGAGSGLKPKTAAGQQKLEEVEEADFLTKWLAEQNLKRDLEAARLREIKSEHIRSFAERDLSVSTIANEAQTKMEQNNALLRIGYAEQEAAAKIEAAQAVGSALGAIADLIGRQTAAGKALAIAQATINMWVGVSEVLRAKSVLPEPMGTIAKVANIATIVASGITAIKNIVKVQVPGGAGGGVGSVPAPLQSGLPASTNTRLDRDQLNQIGNAAFRGFIVESDITNNQERIRRLNRAARL